jgi:hypothetical protein
MSVLEKTLNTAWTCFTSFNQRLWDIIASEMLASWLYHWPAEARIYIYLEDHIDLPQDPRIEVMPWHSTVEPLYQELDRKSQDLPTWQSDQSHRFGKKGMTFVYHMARTDLDRVIWLDADVITLKPVPDHGMFDRSLAGHAAAIFDNPHHYPDGSVVHTAESGFVLFDTRHAGYADIRDHYRGYYDRCEMPEHAKCFWDSEVLSHACHHVPGAWKNLTPEAPGKSSTPLNRHALGQYFQHVKTKKKKHYTKATYQDLWMRGMPLTAENSIYAKS